MTAHTSPAEPAGALPSRPLQPPIPAPAASRPRRPLHILYLEDSPSDQILVATTLEDARLDCQFAFAENKDDFRHALADPTLDLVLCDYSIPGFDGLAALDLARQLRPAVPFIFVSGTINEELAVEGLKAGATDYVFKKHLDRLSLVIRRAVHESELHLARQTAEDALKKSEQRWRLIFEHAPDAMFLIDATGCLLDVNRAAEELVGHSREELIGSHILQLNLLHASARALAAANLARAIAGQPTGPAEYRLCRKDLSSVIAEVRTYPVNIDQQTLTLGIARDVTERRHAEEELRLSEERLRSVWDHSIDGMRLTDHAGRIIAVNDAYCRLVGLPRERLLGQLLSVAYSEKGAEGRLEAYRADFDRGQILPRRSSLAILWNGKVLDLDLAYSFVDVGERGKLVLAIFRDMTDRQQAERVAAAFSSLGQRLSSADTAREAAEIIVDVADQLLGWDACNCDLYCADTGLVTPVLSMDIIDGRRTQCPSDSLTHPPSALARRVVDLGAQLPLRNPGEKLDHDNVPFGNRTRPSASILYVPIHNRAEVIGLLSIHSYTPNAYNEASLHTLQALADHCGGAFNRIRAREALEATQQRLAHLLAESPAVIYSLKHEGTRFVASWYSHYLQQLLGFTPQEACSPSWWLQQVHPDDRGSFQAWLTHLLRHKQITREYRMRHKNGAYRWLRDEQRLVCDPSGEPLEVVGSWVDITQRKALEESQRQLEDQLRQAQKMEAVGQLAGGVAHDFNNLLLVMRGNAELLQLRDAAQAEPFKEGLRQITCAADRAANLTRQLLAFSRKQVMRTQPLILSDVIANISKMLKRIIGENIDLQCHASIGLPHVLADAGMIEQAVVNLVVNARDAMPRGGLMHICTEPVVLSPAQAALNPEARPGEFVRLTVRDTGTGIAPEHLPHIFEPFFTTKQSGKGTGLGLATVYGIIKQHQGWVQVDSHPGSGACFQLFLPAVPAPAAAEPVADPLQPPRGGSETILLVEDDDAVRRITRRVLETSGYRILEAPRASDALDLWAAHRRQIALLLTDVVMPDGVNGDELAARLASDRPGLKVILMTGYSDAAVNQGTEFLRKTNACLLQKPCPSRTLLETVRHSLDHTFKSATAATTRSNSPEPPAKAPRVHARPAHQRIDSPQSE